MLATWMRFSTLLFASVAACGGQSLQSAATPVGEAPGGDGLSVDTAVQLCLRDSPDRPRTDYAFVANFRCADGSRPLGGNSERGANARAGNVGQGSDGHVIDHYEVPCRAGSQSVYVDAYHCGPGENVEQDMMNNLSREALAQIAQRMRALEMLPFDPRAIELRRGLVTWLQGSPQVHLEVCGAVVQDVVIEGYPHRALLLSQFLLSMGAAVIELSDRSEHRIQVALAGVRGSLRLYAEIVAARGQSARNTHLDDLARTPASGLAERVSTRINQCDDPEPEVGFSVEGNTWPPSGPDCERLARCCESNGLVRDGQANGANGLMCLLANPANPEASCTGALSLLIGLGLTCTP